MFALARQRTPAVVRPRRVFQGLVLGAECDVLVPQLEVEQAARFFGCELEIFPGMGHVMRLETVWGKVADRIIEWMQAEELDRA